MRRHGLVCEGIGAMFKTTVLALGLACASVAPALAASSSETPSDQDVTYHVTVLSKRGNVVFEGEGRVDSAAPLVLRQFVLARDNAGGGRAFVDSGIKIELQQSRHDDASVTSRLALDMAGWDHEATATVDLKLGEESAAGLNGYTVKVVATAVQHKVSPLLPEDFAYLAPSLNMESTALPNVRFDRNGYQVANAVLDRPAGQSVAALVAPSSVAAREADAPQLVAARH